MKNSAIRRNESANKLLYIMETMAKHGESIRLQELSKKTDIHPSTLLRFLKTLVDNKYASQKEDSSYALTFKICHLGSLIRSQHSIQDIVRPYLKKISKKCEESSCLAIEHDMEVVYLDAVNGPDKMLKTFQRIGKKAPLHSTGVGKLLLLNYSMEEINEYIKEKGLIPLTNNTITDKEKLLAELKKIRNSGYAIDNEECEQGARCLATPIYNFTGKISASISISGPTSRLSMKKIDDVKDYMKDISQKISELLGYEEDV